MSIIEQAEIELKAINFGEEDSAVMIDILKRFFAQWDSGGGVFVAATVLQRLIAGKPLSPLTGADDEWVDRSEVSGRPMWQNIRCSTVFKREDGVAYDIDQPGLQRISFPYSPEGAEVGDPVIEMSALELGAAARAAGIVK